MKDREELLKQTVKEELEKEAQEIRRMLETSEEEELTEEKKEQMKEKLHQKIDDYELETICEKLPEEYQDALRVGLEIKKQEEEKEEKKVVYRKKKWRVYIAVAAVLILVLAVNVSTIGDGKSFMKTVKSLVGEREVVQTDSAEDNLVMEVDEEEKAYQTVEDEFKIEPVKIMALPQDAGFQKAIIEKELQIAEFYYQYGGENITYIINGDQAKNSIGQGIEDEIVKTYSLEVKGVLVEIQGCEKSATKRSRYYANFSYQDTKYFLSGIMTQDEFEEIINNLYFFEKTR